MALANQEAQRFSHEYIGTEHILLGLIKEGSGVGANVLKNLDVDLAKARREVEKLIKAGLDSVAIGKLPQTPRAKKVIEYAIEEARNLDHNYVGTEHLLMGLLREEDGIAAQVLINLGIELDDAREELRNLLGAPVEIETARRIVAGGTLQPAPTALGSSPPGQENAIQALLFRCDVELARLNQEKEAAVGRDDWEKAAALRELELAFFTAKSDAMRRILEVGPPPVADTAGPPTATELVQIMNARIILVLLQSQPNLAALLGDAIAQLRKAARDD
jgi:hypothetical protein